MIVIRRIFMFLDHMVDVVYEHHPCWPLVLFAVAVTAVYLWYAYWDSVSFLMEHR